MNFEKEPISKRIEGRLLTQEAFYGKENILCKKVAAAKRLIEDGELKINTIAAVLKFYDSHHFFRMFRQYTGMSPTAYREKVSEDTIEEIPQ